MIGSTFVVAAWIGILLLAHDPHGGEELQDMLAGQILWVSTEQLAWTAGTTVALGLVLKFPFSCKGFGFYAVFACALTLSVQLAGVYLVFASLILPALAVRKQPRREELWRAWLLGALGYGSGLAASALTDWPSGTVIVCVIAALSLFFEVVYKPVSRGWPYEMNDLQHDVCGVNQRHAADSNTDFGATDQPLCSTGLTIIPDPGG